MTSAARHVSADTELQALEALRTQYVAQGFSFEVQPDQQQVPAFLGTYRPDAIARKPGENVAIEVREQRTQATDLTLQEIRRRFDGQPDWKFVVVYASSDPLKTLTIPASSIADIRDRLKRVRALEVQGEHRAAFVLGWSLLEATLHSVESASGARPRTPGTVVQTLAMLGHIDPQLEQKVRPLILLRNRVVHGDLTAEPSADDVLLILSAVEQALSEA